MKRPTLSLLSLLTVLVLISPFAKADDGRFGIGFVLGDPTVLSARMNLSSQRAGDVGLSFFSRDYFLVYGDYLFKYPEAIDNEEPFLRQLTPYVGVGPLLVVAEKSHHPRGNYFNETDDSVALGVRVPLGVEWMWDKAPFGVGLEIAPGIVVIPSTVGFLQGGVSFRYYF